MEIYQQNKSHYPKFTAGADPEKNQGGWLAII